MDLDLAAKRHKAATDEVERVIDEILESIARGRECDHSTGLNGVCDRCGRKRRQLEDGSWVAAE